MYKYLIPLLPVVFLSCRPEGDVELYYNPGQYGEEIVATDASGKEYPGLDPYEIYCGPGWGRKFCRFLGKHDGTSWTDSGSRISFSNFSGADIFMSFSNIDCIAPYGEGWKVGETIYRGVKWNIKIKRDEEDVLWVGYEYYGTGDEVEYSVTYKFEVTNSTLTFSSTDGQTLIFSLS